MNEDLGRLREMVDQIGRSPGRRLPPEPKLSDQLGVSRSRLRTLLKRLEAEGLIWRHVGKGTFVGPRQIGPGDRGWSSSVSVDDVFEARLALEPQLAAQAAMHANGADTQAMDRCLTEMAQAESFVHWKQLDEKLHRVIAAATHNPLLVLLYDTLRAQVKPGIEARLADIFGRTPGPRHETDAEHQAFVDDIKAHDPAAAERSMRAHLRSVRRNMFGTH